MSNRNWTLAFGASLTAATIAFGSLAYAAGTAPSSGAGTTATTPATDAGAKKCKKFTAESDKWKACMKAAKQSMNNEDLYATGYQLAKAGDYSDALEFLTAGTGQKDVRFLTMIGYSTRKLGKIDEGMGFYAQALAIDPNSVNTREYLGEAYLQKNDLESAKGQLTEISNRCGTTCEPYKELNDAITKFQAGQL